MMLATQTENAKLGALGIEFPQPYNAAVDLVERNLRAGRADKIAVLDDQGSYTYAQVADRVNRFAGALTALGVCTEQRILLCLHDSIDFPTNIGLHFKSPLRMSKIYTPFYLSVRLRLLYGIFLLSL